MKPKMIAASSNEITQLSTTERIQLVQNIWNSVADSPERADSRTHWERLDAFGDAGIDTSDIPAMTEEEMANSEWRLPAGFQKSTAPPLVVQVAVDPDVLAWFQSQGQDYPARMRAALRLYAEAHQAPA